MSRIGSMLRLVLDVLPTLVLAACTLLLAWQFAHDRPDAALKQVVFVGAVLELCSAMLDALLAESLAERLVVRMIGWIAANLLFGGAVLFIMLGARQLQPTTWFLIALFVVPRFCTFVLMPPRDELSRRRTKALARDRLEAVFATITLAPVVALVFFVVGSASTIYPGMLVGPAALCLLATWLLVVAGAAALVGSAAFARRPQRLLTRGIWPWLAHPLPGRSRMSHEEWRAEEALWLHDSAH